MGKICNQCNSALEQNANFCTFCGSNNIREENVIDNQNAQVNPVQEAQPTPQPEQQPVEQQSILEPQGINKQSQNNIVLENNEVHQDFTQLEFPSTNNDPAPVQQTQQAQPIQPESPQAPVIPSDFKLQSGTDINGIPDANNPFDEALNAQKISNEAKKANKKTMKVILITIGITIAVLIVILAIFIIFVSVSVDFKQEGLTCQEPAPLSPNQMRIGTEGYGFLTVANTWVDITGSQSNTIQYQNSTGWIITMGATTPDQLTAESYANLIEQNLKNTTTEPVYKQQVNLNNYNAYKISASVPSYQKYIEAWTFAAEDGNVHYLAVEGPNSTGQEYSIVQTFGVCR